MGRVTLLYDAPCIDTLSVFTLTCVRSLSNHTGRNMHWSRSMLQKIYCRALAAEVQRGSAGRDGPRNAEPRPPHGLLSVTPLVRPGQHSRRGRSPAPWRGLPAFRAPTEPGVFGRCRVLPARAGPRSRSGSRNGYGCLWLCTNDGGVLPYHPHAAMCGMTRRGRHGFAPFLCFAHTD